ncbi:hypothetical protein Agub_g2035 [Astrephomene gubernaculifera]|uniref:Uncharacterized protein n=1 Tax=Astrephomene gubernaculifera TaxID=47775 RepID=A0AAD3DHM9_9CHLO|nr:hypothetical protein Agub_g2035 [Astrephomene gubernaculifera]
MERSAAVPGRAFGGCATVLSYHRTPCLLVPTRHVTPVLTTRHVPCRAALSDGGSQGMSAALNPNLVRDPNGQIEFGDEPPTRAAVPLKGDRERVGAGDAPPSSPHSSWDEWLRHFDNMDELAEDAAHYQVELNTAVRQERYGDAARHKRKLQEIQASDTVAAVQKQLQDALAAEDYGEAAQLRDRGLVGLAGWWAGRDGPQDFHGHLLHVKPEFGRWTGRIYMARDIAAMNGWRENKLVQLLDRGVERGSGSGSSRAGRGGGVLEGAAGLGGGTIGTPMLEVFVRQQPSGSGSGDQQQKPLVPGRLVHQAVALRPPSAASDPRDAAGEGAQAEGAAAQLNPASVVRLSIHVSRDGSARISVLPPQPVKSEFSSWEEEEMRATMEALAAGDLTASPERFSRARNSGSSSPSAEGFQSASDDDDEDDEDDILTELTRVPAQVAMQGRDRFVFSVLEAPAAEAAAAAASSSSTSAGAPKDATGRGAAADGSGVDLPRWAAVPIDDDEEEGEAGTAAAAQRRASGSGAGTSSAAAASAADVPVMELEVKLPEPEEDGEEERGAAGRRTLLDAVDEATEAARAAALAGGFEAGLVADEDDDDDDSAVQVSLDLISTGRGSLDAVATSVTDAEEQRIVIEIPVGRLMRQQREQEQQRRASGAEAGSSSSSSAASGAGRGAGKDTFDRLAERVAQLQASRAGRRVPPEHLATALRSLAQRLLSGELAPDGSSAATASVPSPAAAAAQKAAAALRSQSPSNSASTSSSPSSLNSTAKQQQQQSSSSQSTSPSQSQHPAGGACIAYTRIPTDLPRSDPFCGLYLGAFGPHGPELLQLSRVVQDGEEEVVGTKVTGDPNVPAGELSFRAKVGRRHRLDSRDVYPEHLGVVARYKGEGRVAMAGYKSPRWVDGELLVFAVGASPVTGGAELGFVWAVPGEKRFLILLNKLDLKECEK